MHGGILINQRALSLLYNFKLLVGCGVVALLFVVAALILSPSVYQDGALVGAILFIVFLCATAIHAVSSAKSSPNTSWKLDPNGLPDAIIISHLNGNIETFNQAAKEMLPNCGTAITVKDLFDVWHAELADRQQADQVIEAVLSSPNFQYSETLELKGGQMIERHTRPLPAQTSRIWILRDLTHLHAAKSDNVMHTSMLEADAARTAELAEQLFHAKAELEMKQAELRRLANTDSLTGLLNRRRFTARGEKAIESASSPSLWIVMMDIDHFKRINDTYGHAAGDIAIKNFATIAKEEVGDAGFVGRMGGEEFAAILQDADMHSAVRVAEAIRKKTANHQTVSDAEKFRFTVSIGVAAWMEGEISIEAALDRADQALYSAKSYGRNRVVGYELS